MREFTLKVFKDVQDSPLLMSKFRDAQIWAKKITQEMIEKSIRMDFSKEKPYLVNSDGGDEILFYC